MESDLKCITVSEKNLDEHPGVICFINPKHKSHSYKIEWIRQRFDEGLTIKLLYENGQKKPVGFIEYIPGENAWRAVSARGHLFIHCIYVYPNKNKGKGFGKRLIDECLADAGNGGYRGVAVVTSSAAFMAGSDLFAKNGFTQVDRAASNDELWVKTLKDGPKPTFNDCEKRLSAYDGLHVIYTKQCPWVARFVDELRGTSYCKDLNLTITELKEPSQAQKAPSIYATFNLVHDGKILADRYISMTRFRNILRKEKLL
ncbi:MAG: GNAT family N-acetyltransferase [Chitinivibrionales bacterium]|nr:GNAT family N-acetyltransferase [Chitinivibrionales bacterium]MBD3358588.1 GNAT family N-acetyltransferase [Chitinivibrionales bacterium]